MRSSEESGKREQNRRHVLGGGPSEESGKREQNRCLVLGGGHGTAAQDMAAVLSRKTKMQEKRGEKGKIRHVEAEYAVLGGGFAGISVAWHLLQHCSKTSPMCIEIYDEVGLGGGASGVSGGLLHPYSPK
ncbi:hypothetical protein KI387_041070, partial [Taxus chinensis]